MKISKKKDGSISYVYTGDLEREIAKCQKELDQKCTSQEREFLRWQYKRAKAALDTYENRITALGRFIRLAKEKLEEEREEGAAQ